MKHLFNQKITRIGLICIPIIVVAIGMYTFSMLPKDNVVNLEGSVEISTNSYFCQVNGTVSNVFAETGEEVKAGDILAILDEGDVNNQIEQLKATLIMKEAKLNQLKKNPDVGNIDAAQRAAEDNVAICKEKLATAERALQDAENDLETQRGLFEQQAIAKNELQQYERIAADRKSEVSIASAQLSAAKNNVNTFEYPKKDGDEISAAMADVRLTELQIEQAEQSKQDYTIKALKDGIVISKNIDIGATVILGQDLFEISKENDKYFVFYLPQEHMDKVEFGDEISLYRVNHDKEFGKAKISYMDWKPVYTPKDYETSGNKNKKSIKIKALIESNVNLGVGETLVTKIQNQAMKNN